MYHVYLSPCKSKCAAECSLHKIHKVSALLYKLSFLNWVRKTCFSDLSALTWWPHWHWSFTHGLSGIKYRTGQGNSLPVLIAQPWDSKTGTSPHSFSAFYVGADCSCDCDSFCYFQLIKALLFFLSLLLLRYHLRLYHPNITRQAFDPCSQHPRVRHFRWYVNDLWSDHTYEWGHTVTGSFQTRSFFCPENTLVSFSASNSTNFPQPVIIAFQCVRKDHHSKTVVQLQGKSENKVNLNEYSNFNKKGHAHFIW